MRSVAERLTAKLNAVLSFPQSQGSLGQILYRLAALSAEIFDARTVVAPSTAKLSQVIQLQYILNSRVAEIAPTQGLNSATAHPMLMQVQHRDRVAEVVAKSFYVEMKKAGFGPNEIINAASEILSQLSNSLRKGVEA